ncbi:chemotaxis protein CheA [Gallaecimonas xiamenensis]|uniref:Chemotaxis protein CheA n=1 Tax=Gallaecimonas xiamenensis 3-C-1 TaxID=745411 RepID=K2K0L6_9GAMM|nr:chemotaxis protein CheA [Gallaecimonas xiamenensis]EKE71050.1 chemotaxis protein CheA [Gallaecimonas xiamenensis 3-C-1]
MELDMDRFRQIFLQECAENLAVLESDLLALERGSGDEDCIHRVFRAAHSIKGGAGTFGLKAMSGFTHHLETLLDELRSGKRSIDANLVSLMLKATDVIAQMRGDAEGGGEGQSPEADAVRGQLEAALGMAAAPPEQAKASAAQGSGDWQLVMQPHGDILASGNEPLRLLRELAALGFKVISVSLGALHQGNYQPEHCYLGWTLAGPGQIPEADIREIFEWVEDECDISLSRQAGPAEAAPQPQAEAKAQVAEAKAAPEQSIRIDIRKIDALINLVGELVITQSMLASLEGLGGEAIEERFSRGLSLLKSNTKALQESVLGIRMLPISFAFNRFPRLVRDLAKQLGKDVDLKLVGEQTELDKTVLERIGDPLVHMVRNALDHGIEQPGQRRQAGKNPKGTLTLSACHEGGNVVIDIRDDGAGLNKEKLWQKACEKGLPLTQEHKLEELSDGQVYDLIFAPGFSTAAAVSDLSGRGVGMDVVKRNISELGGSVEIQSQLGRGTLFRIRLPLTMAILDGQLVAVGDELFVIPLINIVESLKVEPDCLLKAGGGVVFYQLRQEMLPVIWLAELLGTQGEPGPLPLLCVVEAAGRKLGLVVDALLAQQQVVIKSLEQNFRRLPGISGATILGDGQVCLILDVPGLVSRQVGRDSDSAAVSAA